MKPIVIGFAGPAGAGKTTAARVMTDLHGAVRLPFAAPMKRMLRVFLEDQGVDPETALRMTDGDLKEVPTPYLGGATPRRAMQTLGTEWGRGLSPTLWVDAWRRSIDRCLAVADGLESVPVVADDLRFPEEAAAIRDLGGVVVRTERPGSGLAGSAGGHASETTDIGPPDAVILNDGALDWLEVQIDELMGRLPDPACRP
jgi:hypothetical protein